MKNSFTQRLSKILLLMLFCCPIVFTQKTAFIKYDGNLKEVSNDRMYPFVKEGYLNDELLDKLQVPPYSNLYSLYFDEISLNIGIVPLYILDNVENINILEHCLKFEKEEFVEKVSPVTFGRFTYFIPPELCSDIKGQILHNGKPLINHLVHINLEVYVNEEYIIDTLLNQMVSSITDEDGNYFTWELSLWPLISIEHVDIVFPRTCTLSFKIGNTKYDTTFVLGKLDKDTVINFNITPIWKEFEVKGQILQNGEPLIYRTVTLTDQFDFVCRSFTDKNGNYTFPYMREDYNYTLSFEIGDTKYDTTFVLDEDKSIDFNIYAPTSDIKGKILKDGNPLSNHTIYTYNEFNLYNCTTDENGNYTFPDMVEKYDYTLFCRVGDTRYDTSFVLDDNKTLDFNIGDVDIIDVNKPEEIPTTYSLSQNYPNPFNPTTTIQYSIPKDEFVKLTVYDITGRVVKELVNGYKSAGKHSVEFNTSNYSSGTYYYRLETGGYKDIKKMMLVK